MNSLFHLQSIHWREPLWLLLALQPVLFLFFKRIIQKNNISLYAEEKLQLWIVFPSYYSLTKKIFTKNFAYLIAWILFSIALAGPRIPLSQVGKDQLYDVNIMLVVDLSRSMKAMDIVPNRLRRAKIEIFEFLEKAQEHRIGVTVFAARPHLFVPITSDHAVLKTYLESLDNLTFPTTGSKPVDAILFAQKELMKVKGKSAIILISDGDFPAINNTQLNELKQRNIPLYVLGVGSIEGEAIQLTDGSWLKYNGQHVISKMEENKLRNLANQLSGNYSPVYDSDEDWKTLYDNGMAGLTSLSNLSNKQRILWREYFPYFLFPSLLLFLFSLSTYQLNKLKNISTIILISIFINFVPENNANALEIGQSSEQAAYREYIKGNYKKAEKLYQSITGYRSHFGQGNSLYKMGHYKKSIRHFIAAILDSKNDEERVNALYNLANSYFRTGAFSSAIDTYNDVLLYQPENEASIYNMKISKLLKENIERRLREKKRIIRSLRQGRGARSATIADGTDISENTSVSFDGSETSLKKNIPLPELPGTNENMVEKLIQSGLKNIEFAKQGNTFILNEKQAVDNNFNIIKAQQQLDKINDSQHLLWKRLFEIEEGFPAPVEKPRTLPGVKPW